ncbi:MAG: hypothetical protein Q9190_004120 [Brigantiaea leucoxantha]
MTFWLIDVYDHPIWAGYPASSSESNHGLGIDPITNAGHDIDQPPIPPPGDEDEYVALCIAVKDQHLDLPEFLRHHYHHLGVRRFYIMDDGSIPPLSTHEYGIPSEAITFSYYYPTMDHQKQMQYRLYSECFDRFGERHTWLGFFDADEYLEMTGGETLVEFLRTFGSNGFIGAVGVNWKTHTSSALLERPSEGCRKSFTTCIIDDPEQDNRHIKSFVKSQFFGGAVTPHYFHLKNGTRTVGEHEDAVPKSWRTPITRDRIALHHYGVKSKAQYLEKENRGNAMNQPKTMEWWDHIEGMEHAECSEMANYDP